MTTSKPKTLVLYPPSPNIVRAGLALPVLFSYLKSRGLPITVLDCPGLEMTNDEVLAKIAELDPEIVGISVSATVHLGYSLETIRLIRARFPDKLLVAGGIHVTLCPEDLVASVDFVAIRDGFETLAEIIGRYPDRAAIRELDGIAYRDGGKTVYTPDRISDIRKVPRLDFSCLPMERYYFDIVFGDPTTRSIPTFYTLGCPNRCTFCANKRLTKGRIQYRDPDLVLDEMEENSGRYGVNCFGFMDPCFTAIPKKAAEFCRRYVARGCQLRWGGNCTINTVDDGLMELMAQAGCRTLAFGIESLDDGILKSINKPYQNFAKIRHALELSKRLGLFTPIGIIIGHIDDTIDTVYETITKCAQLEISSLGFSLLTPFPGCDDHDRAKESNFYFSQDFSTANYWTVNYIPVGLKDYNLWKCRCFGLYYFFSRTAERLDYWLGRLAAFPDFEGRAAGWRELYDHRRELDYDYYRDYTVLDPARRKVPGRRFYEPYLPDFSAAHKKEYFKLHARLTADPSLAEQHDLAL